MGTLVNVGQIAFMRRANGGGRRCNRRTKFGMDAVMSHRLLRDVLPACCGGIEEAALCQGALDFSIVGQGVERRKEAFGDQIAHLGVCRGEMA